MGGPGENAYFGTLLSKKLWQTIFADCLRDYKVCLEVRKANWILLVRKLQNPVTALFLLDFVWLVHQELLLNLGEETWESMIYTFFAWLCPVRSLRFEYDIHIFCWWGERLLLPLLGNNFELQMMMFLSSYLWWRWQKNRNFSIQDPRRHPKAW